MGYSDRVGQAEDAQIQLIDRVARGDAEALGALYDHYGRVSFAVAYRMLGDPEAAEEVVQNAFHSVWRNARAYRPDRGSLRTWLLAICRNAAVDWRRRNGKWLAHETASFQAADLVATESVDDAAGRTLRAERVRAAVRALPVEQREVIALAFWAGLTQTEIAGRLRIPLGTVKGRVRLGMQKLRATLDESEDGTP